MMNERQACAVISDNRLKDGGWSNTLNDRRYRNNRAVVIPQLGGRSVSAWQSGTIAPVLSSKENGKRTGDAGTKSRLKAAIGISGGTLLPYTWKHTDGNPEYIKQATDRSYKHTYGDELSTPFELKIQKDLPSVRQKTEVKSSLKSSHSDISAASFSLPSAIVTKIYNNLHQEAEDKRCMYVIKNMRRTTPAAKPAHLPTIIPFYNVQLVKSVSKVLTEELLIAPSPQLDEFPSESIQRPMAEERKYYSQISGKLVKSFRRSANHTVPKVVDDGEIPDYLSSNRVFKSADAYNKLITLRHANRNSTNKSLMSGKRHSTAKHSSRGSAKSSKSLTKIRSHSNSQKDEHESVETSDSIPEIQSTKHITAIKVHKRIIKYR